MGTEDAPDNKCETISDLESKIIRQVEYYFGDYNLMKDRFLKERIKENDGLAACGTEVEETVFWNANSADVKFITSAPVAHVLDRLEAVYCDRGIPLETMVKFNRLKQLSEDYAVIAGALKKSPNQLMEVSDDGTMIRRSLSKPLPDAPNVREQMDQRSVYVKGFKTDSTLDELLDFFKPYRNPENILMRRRPNKKFKGSVFVTFKTKEDAEAFLALKEVKYNGTDLLREPKLDYVKRKHEQYEERQRLKEEKKKKAAESEKAKDENEGSGVTCDMTRGCLLKMTGFSENTMREDIKEVLEKHGQVSYIDFKKGDAQAVVRFEYPVASEVLEKATKEVDGERKVEVNGTEVSAVLIEGDEETAYWETIATAKRRVINANKGMRKKGWSRGGKYNRGKKRKRGAKGNESDDEGAAEEEDQQASGDEDEPKAKVLKKEDMTAVGSGKDAEQPAEEAAA